MNAIRRPNACARLPPTTGPSAGPRRCAVCTQPIALAICAAGADCAAMVSANMPYPAKSPCTARNANTCHGAVTNAMAAMITTKLKSDRATISLWP